MISKFELGASPLTLAVHRDPGQTDGCDSSIARFAPVVRPDIVWPLIVLSGHLLNGEAAEAEEEVVTEMLGSLVTRHRFNQSVML